MKIKKLYLQAFGKFIDRHFDFAPGINLVYGNNEAGKSTLREFIFSMLYGQKKYGIKKRSYLPSRDLYHPWNQNLYKGALTYSLGRKTYRVERNFHSDFEEVRIFKDDNGEEITTTFPIDARKEPQFLLEQIGLNEKHFKSTVFIEQSEMAGLLYRNKENVLEELLGKIIYGIEGEQGEKSVRAVIEELKKKKKEIGTPKSKNKPLGIIYGELREKRELKFSLEDKREALYKNQKNLTEIIKKEQELEKKEKALYIKKNNLKKQWIRNKITAIENILGEIKELENYIHRNFPVEIQDKSASSIFKAKERIEKMSTRVLITTFLSLGIIISIFFGAIIYNYIWVQLPMVILFFIASIWGIFKWKAISKKKKQLTGQLEKTYQYQDAAQELERLQRKFQEETKEYSLEQLKMNLKSVEVGETIFTQEYLPKEYDMDLEWEEIKNERYNILTQKAFLEGKIQESDWDVMKLEQIEREIYNLKTKIEEMEENIQAIDIAIDTLEEIEKNEKDKWGPHVIKKAEDNIFKITKKYHTIKMDGQYHIRTLDPSTEKFISIEQLSWGTFCQFYFALRLSFVQLLSHPSISLPIVLDEPFVGFDDERFEESMALLEDLAKNHQIILFSSQKREKKYLEKKNIVFNDIKLMDK